MNKRMIALALFALLCNYAADKAVDIHFMEEGRLSEQVRLLDALKHPPERVRE